MKRSHAGDAFNPKPGVAEEVAPGVRRILAPNPSPMTFRGTNSYLIGTTGLALIDPGPEILPHLDALLSALTPGQFISHILVTHSHLDHSPLARRAAAATGAPVLAFGPATAGRSPIMQDLAQGGLIGGGEGLDHDFSCDQILADGDIVTGDSWELEAIHTPGHIGNHLCFALGDLLFSGDHVMGWSSSLVSPPDGDLTDFMASCRRLQTRSWSCFLPGHGPEIHTPKERLAWLLAHRQQREAAILAHLAATPATAAALAAAIYTETPAALLGAAERNVFAHLVDLYQQKRIAPIGAMTATTSFRLLD
ncbi:MBL fold metallo-hydrolase [Tritonibacter horizontis]|uniref:Hydroxyacylglutathione hydrolase n=1 Tax=Tritonibacter horizontis TaxID=1768241 RepID=A0A132BWE9_9RHOB|nr:MBL fold metallo-hydrolase [Tritonibacter horizontis]KUP92701.1 hydroxyacylglutathione hydrolase [Tritonibacter horizontis]